MVAPSCWPTAVLRAQEPTLDVVLAHAAGYVARYQQQLRGLVAEETYRQNVMSTAAGRTIGPGARARQSREGRELKSDLLLVKLGDENFWMQFRDVFEVDRKPVRDRDQRLYKLFVEAKADARAQAESIQQESARYNLGPIMRTINVPIMALLFLERSVQPSSSSSRARPATSSASRASPTPAAIWMIEYRETSKGTMVKGAQQPGHPVARPHLARQHERPRPADRIDQRGHRPPRRHQRHLQGGARPRPAGAGRNARDLHRSAAATRASTAAPPTASSVSSPSAPRKNRSSDDSSRNRRRMPPPSGESSRPWSRPATRTRSPTDTTEREAVAYFSVRASRHSSPKTMDG